MLDKCATQGCEQKFKYFGSGMLFLARDLRRGDAEQVEFFWLCERCARDEHPLTMRHLPLRDRNRSRKPIAVEEDQYAQ